MGDKDLTLAWKFEAGVSSLRNIVEMPSILLYYAHGPQGFKSLSFIIFKGFLKQHIQVYNKIERQVQKFLIYAPPLQMPGIPHCQHSSPEGNISS